MLAEYCTAPVQVQVQVKFGLGPGWARKILTVSGDAIRGKSQPECQKLLKEITIDGRSVACDRRYGLKARPGARKKARTAGGGAERRSRASSTPLRGPEGHAQARGAVMGRTGSALSLAPPGRSRVRWSSAADRRPTFTRTQFTRTSRPSRQSHWQAQVRIKRGPTSGCYRPDPLPPRISSARSRSVSRSATV